MAGKEEMNHSETSTLQSFAERVYNLDEKVYKILGSGLGRVYNFDRYTQVEVKSVIALWLFAILSKK